MLEGKHIDSGNNCVVLYVLLGCIGMCARVYVCYQTLTSVFLYSDNHINVIALLCMRASVKQFDTQHLKWWDLVTL
jgi:hypothetical protein